VEHLFHCGSEHTEEVEQKFVEVYPKSNVPHHNRVWQLINMFRETGSFADVLRSGKQTV
jgi:hypothetical protein